MKLTFSAVLILLLTSVSVNSSEAAPTVTKLQPQQEKESWLCAAEEVIGFIDGKEGWKQDSFDIKDERFLLRPLKKSDAGYVNKLQLTYGAFELGNKRSNYLCRELDKDIICKAFVGEFNFSRESLRFLSSYMFGFWDGVDTPLLIRGTCTSL